MPRTVDGFQHTLAGRTSLKGIGVHGGRPAQVILGPGAPGTGIVFVRTEAGRPLATMPALSRSVVSTDLCTVLGDEAGVTIGTVEHLMAALSALDVDNAVVEIDGPEVPIMDGSSRAFVAAIEAVGLVSQPALRRYIRVLKPVRVDAGEAFGEFEPWPTRRFEVTIAFEEAAIGSQSMGFDLSPTLFAGEIAAARTFGRVADVERLWKMGLARGSSLENSVAIVDGRVANPEGTRWPDEFVRHKSLDAVGDIALAGHPIIGLYRSYKGGHRINAGILRALFADPSAYEVVELSSLRRVPVNEGRRSLAQVAAAE